MPLYSLLTEGPFEAPALVAALDGWVDAGGCGTTAAEHIAAGGDVVATFDADALVDYRARRPTLDIEHGRLAELGWPELTVRRAHLGARDILVLTGPEPDYRWQEFQRAVVDLSLRLGVLDGVCLGAIGAMVPHTRPTPIMTTGTHVERLEGDPPLPSERMRVPAAAVTLIEMGLEEVGIRTAGFWAQVPHYVAGGYTAGALALVQRAAAHLGVIVPLGDLVDGTRNERARLDEAVAASPDARAFVERMEEMGIEGSFAPPEGMGSGSGSGEGIAAEAERFLREITGEDRGPVEEP